jgi:peptide/nickel transport system permease protein
MKVATGLAGEIKRAKRERSFSYWGSVWKKFTGHRLAVSSLLTLMLITLAVVFGPLLIPYEPDRIDFRTKDEGPSLQHPMGTDELGRDQLVRILHGGRMTLAVALAAVTGSIVIGVSVGAVAGYVGRLTDNALMRLVDVFYSLPALFVLIIVVSLFGASFWTIVLALSLLRWMATARLVRASFLSLKEMEYVEASRALGGSGTRIVLSHILPNALSPIIVASTLGIAGAILTESALSFLGLGFQPPQATWGRMLQEAQRAVVQQGHWWRGFFPGLMIFMTVLSVNYVGDGLRDALDPKKAS